jgi:hypothetical protein
MNQTNGATELSRAALMYVLWRRQASALKPTVRLLKAKPGETDDTSFSLLRSAASSSLAVLAV